MELKNGETYNGNLVSVDQYMNLQLSDVICTSKVRLTICIGSRAAFCSRRRIFTGLLRDTGCFMQLRFYALEKLVDLWRSS